MAADPRVRAVHRVSFVLPEPAPGIAGVCVVSGGGAISRVIARCQVCAGGGSAAAIAGKPGSHTIAAIPDFANNTKPVGAELARDEANPHTTKTSDRPYSATAT